MPEDNINRYTLAADADTNDEYPTRCSSCDRPVQRYSIFPKDRCLDCHAAVTPMPTAADVIRSWGG
jgi:hypothetical protein